MIRGHSQQPLRFEGRSWRDIPYETIPTDMPGCRILWHAQRLIDEHDLAERAAAKAEQRPARPSLDRNVAYERAARLVAEEHAGAPELRLGGGLS